MNKEDIIKALKAIAEQLEKSNPSDVRRFVRDRLQPILASTPRQRTQKVRPANLDNISWDKVKTRLACATSLAEGRQILTEEGLDKKRRYLEHLARDYSVAIRKSTRMDRLADEIIQSVVGSRIYSETIANLEMRLDKDVAILKSKKFQEHQDLVSMSKAT